jgi:hypothetical protein
MGKLPCSVTTLADNLNIAVSVRAAIAFLMHVIERCQNWPDLPIHILLRGEDHPYPTVDANPPEVVTPPDAAEPVWISLNAPAINNLRRVRYSAPDGLWNIS